tara:strand:- start:48 stop:563 length:516 start_codon:yes stop_codon:yes gene_type:complete
MGNSGSLPESISSISSGRFTGGISTVTRDVVNTGTPSIESTRDVTDEDIVISRGTRQLSGNANSIRDNVLSSGSANSANSATSATSANSANSATSANIDLSKLSDENFWKLIGINVLNIIAVIIWIIFTLYALKYSMKCNYEFKQKFFGFIKSLLLGPIYFFWLKMTCDSY